MSRYDDREFAARTLAHFLKCTPNEWRYDGTHAAGNQMLDTVDVVIGALKARGWAQPESEQHLG